MAYTYEYPRPAVTTDCVLLALDGLEVKVLLIKRAQEPFRGQYAFPGGFLEMDEAPDDCAKRELKEETGLKIDKVFEVGAFGGVDRDPRGRVISIAFAGVLGSEKKIAAASDAMDAIWADIQDLPDLAFDHDIILKKAILKVKALMDNILPGEKVDFNFYAHEIQTFQSSFDRLLIKNKIWLR